MNQWSPKNVALVIMAVGWVLLGTIAIFKGAPLPSMPMLPLSEPHARQVVDRYVREDRGIELRSVDVLAERKRELELEEREADVGIRAVAPGQDRCFGKNCQALSFEATAGQTYGLKLDGANRKICMLWDVASQTCSVEWFYSAGALTTNAAIDIRAQRDLYGTTVQATTLLESNGAALTTGAACSPAGSMEYDTAGGCWKDCGAGLTWSGCHSTVGNAGVSATWSSYCVQSPCTKGETAGDSFVMPLRNVGGTVARIECNWRTVGVGGTTGLVAAIFNQTDATELCSCALTTNCALGIGTVVDCACAGTVLAGKSYVVRLKSTTDCATIPGGIGCVVPVIQ